jgi:ribosomal protein S18 acetylase RimI-like enzyme
VRSKNYQEALKWAEEYGDSGKVLTAWIPEIGFQFATKNEDGSLSFTRDGFGLGIGPDPIIEEEWSNFALPASLPKEKTVAFQLVGRWNPFFIETSKVADPGDVVKISDVGIKDFLDSNAPNSSTYPGNPEIQFWAGIKVSNELMATGCLAKWESGRYILSSIATKESERGMGYGEKLTRGLVALAGQIGINEVYLAVSAKNPVAQRVYERIGFKSLGQFHTYERKTK